MNEGTNKSIVRVPTSLDTTFFRYWFEFLRPLHKLTDREIDVITCFIKHRFILSKVIHDEELLDKVVMSEDTKKKIIEECRLKPSHFQVIMGKLRQNKLIKDGKLNHKYIPSVSKDADGFKLLLYFDFQ